MRTAETVLSIISERGKQGLPLEDIYRQLYNPELYLRAYGRLYSNAGATTPGTTGESVDGMSLAKIDNIIDALRSERYRWTPVKRTYIAKKNGKLRPLGMPNWSDKLLQEVLRSILEAYYDPQFSNFSHGFRTGRGCHSALSEVKDHWTGIHWLIEGDIVQFFDRMDHQILLAILKEKLKDNRFVRLIANLLKAGYLEDWKFYSTHSGVPQGAVISPILSNIYLDKLDKYVEEKLLPANWSGKRRHHNNRYFALMHKMYAKKREGEKKAARLFRKLAQQLPTGDPHDTDYRRLRYVRYADDWLIGFAGPKAQAVEIKQEVSKFLRTELKLELSEEKTFITNATTESAKFLGYELVKQYVNTRRDPSGARSVNGKIGLRVPAKVVEGKCNLYKKAGKPHHRAELISDSDFTIINQYQSEYRGVVQYYLLAQNVAWFQKLNWVMNNSLLKTLASKHKTSVRKLAHKYAASVQTAYGSHKCLELVIERGEGKQALVARFGGIPLRQQETAILNDKLPIRFKSNRNELVKRLLAQECELCGSLENIEVHHIHKLADLKQEGRKEKPIWMKVMSYRRRKTLVVCQGCHDAIHAGKQNEHLLKNRKKLLESRDEAKVSSPVREGADRKVHLKV